VRLLSKAATSIRLRYQHHDVVVALEPGKELTVDAARLTPSAEGRQPAVAD
jgi:alpha-L-fucosidase 2